ncbi:PI-PLC domain-containing protein [Caulobacter hibisci]|uniref:Phosphatidylinositol diacylglycerol-lyase n=1 Tax=Caulobacter hibisci TaxID=2035993 RepID=A0ABS0T2Q5_9CAUL|nr:hypothetical protein [Caulobacter hibisci]MBI1686157.1 hypothetical protein [Caulobacter hibisci]
MNYRTVKCYTRATGAFAGYLGSYENTLYLFQSTSEASAVKWTYRDHDLYLAKEENDRWLGEGRNNYAGWGLGSTWYAPVLYNDDKSISLKSAPDRHLRGPDSDGYLYWSADDSATDILTFELIEPAAWMKHIPGETLLSAINIPGTHDSAAINETWTTFYSCHDRTISDQLEGGVRLLDVRLQIVPTVSPTGGDTYSFNTCHGDHGLGFDFHVYEPLAELLATCSDFLSRNPSEVVAMSLKIDDQNGVADTDLPSVLDTLLGLLGSYGIAPLSGQMRSLANVRGKVYLIDRIIPDLIDPQRQPQLAQPIVTQIENDDFGIPLAMPDNTPGAGLPPKPPKRPFPLYVQDQYKDLPIGNAEVEKFGLFVQAQAFKPADGLLIDFASATQLALLGVYIQDKVVAYIDSNRPSSLGWCLFDYEERSFQTTLGMASPVEMIIASNFGYPS